MKTEKNNLPDLNGNGTHTGKTNHTPPVELQKGKVQKIILISLPAVIKF